MGVQLAPIAGLLALLASAPAPPAAVPKAERPRADRLAVLPILLEGKYGAATSSGIFNDVAAACDMRLGLRVVSYEEMFVATEEGLGDRVRDCGSDTGCISARLRTFNARLGLVVVLDFASSPPLMSLQLLDTDDGRMLASSVGEVRAPKSGGISSIIRKSTSELLDKAGYPRAGRVVVEVEPPNAHVILGDGLDPDIGTSNRFTVTPGRYPVTASLDGWSSGKSEVLAVTGAEAKVQLALVKDSTLIASPWFWVVVGVAVAGGTLGVLAATRHTSHCLCLYAGCDCER